MPMLLFISFFCCCSLVYVVIDMFCSLVCFVFCMSLLLPMLMFINLFCCCSLVYIVVH